MNVVADHDRCTGAGKCVTVCPEVFAQDDDGVVVLLDDSPGEELRAGVEEAIAVCPAACLDLAE